MIIVRRLTEPGGPRTTPAAASFCTDAITRQDARSHLKKHEMTVRPHRGNHEMTGGFRAPTYKNTLFTQPVVKGPDPCPDNPGSIQAWRRAF